MYYGTSEMMQLEGPVEPPSPLRQTLFDAFRIMETIRAIIYGDGTFLSQDARPSLASTISGWSNQMETIQTHMIETATFSKL